MSHTDLEKRLRERTIAVRGSAGVFTTVLSHKPDALCIEAADALADLTRKLEEARLKHFREAATIAEEEGLWRPVGVENVAYTEGCNDAANAILREVGLSRDQAEGVSDGQD